MAKINWNDIEMIGDKVLIAPKEAEKRTEGGLFLPPGVKEKEQVHQGYIIRTGPGYMLPSAEPDEDWKPMEDRIDFIPLQVEEGDLAVYLKRSAWEVRIAGDKYFIVPQSAILMIFKNEFVDELEKYFGREE